MQNEFAFLQLSRYELVEMHRSLLQRFVADVVLRREQGLEPPSEPMLLQRLETLLGLSDEEAHHLFHQAEDELWEYSWYAYTDEWAWHRARQDVVKKLGASIEQKAPAEIEALVEKMYEEKFERYAGEIDMKEGASKTKGVKHPKKK